jgi:hypothetical protein
MEIIQRYLSDPNYSCRVALSSNNAKTLDQYKFTLFMFFINNETGLQDKAFSISNKYKTKAYFREEGQSDLLKFSNDWKRFKLSKADVLDMLRFH